MKTVRGRHRSHDWHRRLAVPAEHGMEEVRLLRLRRQSRRRAASLNIDYQERQLKRHGKADGLRLEIEARPACRGDTESPAESGSQGGPDPGDLVLGLVG